MTVILMTLRLVMKGEREIKLKRNKWCTLEFLTTCWPKPSLSPSSDQHLPPSVHLLNMTFYGMEYPFVLAMLPPSYLCLCSLAEHGKLKISWFRVSSAQHQLKHQCVINTLLILSPKDISLCQLLGRKLTPTQVKPGHIHMLLGLEAKANEPFRTQVCFRALFATELSCAVHWGMYLSCI